MEDAPSRVGQMLSTFQENQRLHHKSIQENHKIRQENALLHVEVGLLKEYINKLLASNHFKRYEYYRYYRTSM